MMDADRLRTEILALRAERICTSLASAPPVLSRRCHRRQRDRALPARTTIARPARETADVRGFGAGVEGGHRIPGCQESFFPFQDRRFQVHKYVGVR